MESSPHSSFPHPPSSGWSNGQIILTASFLLFTFSPVFSPKLGMEWNYIFQVGD